MFAIILYLTKLLVFWKEAGSVLGGGVVPMFLTSILAMSNAAKFIARTFSRGICTTRRIRARELTSFTSLLSSKRRRRLRTGLSRIDRSCNYSIIIIARRALSNTIPRSCTSSFFSCGSCNVKRSGDNVLFLVAVSRHG